MKISRLLVLATFCVALVSSCQCGTSGPGTPGGGQGGGGTAGGGSGTGGGTTGGGSGGSTGGGAGGGMTTADGGQIADPNDPNNPARDADCDGLSNAEEFGNVYAGGKQTNPNNPDTDGDGIPDGVEAGRTMSPDPSCTGFVGDADPATKTLPTDVDSDTDGIPDGVEDTNKSGRADQGETDPTNPDSDFDSLKDGVEDANKNGTVDPGETDPRKRDTDGDGISDGVEVNVTKTDPTKIDTDGDTCADGAEDLDQDGVLDQGETNPKMAGDCGATNNPDTDSDGIPNKVEDKNLNGTVDPGETDPTKADTDGDGLKDGIEDSNKNGVFEVGETNPLRKDTDCDGLLDGPDNATIKGEDLNANGLVDTLETDPRNRDSDGDGITDGVEKGITQMQLADVTNCMNVPFDADPTTTTDPKKRDSDGDGIDDGAEDTNQNGKVDPGELNPGLGTDGTGPAGQVCTAMNLRPVVFKIEGDADIQLGLPATFTELTTMTVGGTKRGVIGFDSVNKVGFIAYRRAAPSGSTTATADEAAIRAQITPAVTNASNQAFTTWDNYPATSGFYDYSPTTDVKTQLNALAESLVGAGAGALTGMGGAVGPYKIQAEYIHRSNTSVVVVIAIAPAPLAEPKIFSVSDTASGSGVAQFGDANAIQCETFAPKAGNVDFIFVIDDSGSMAASQGALGTAATAIGTALANSTVQPRFALVSSSYSGGGNGFRGFTTDINLLRAWLTQNSTCNNSNVCTVVNPMPACTKPAGQDNGGCWVGINGSGSEKILESAAKAVSDATATNAPAAIKARADAKVVVVLLGDADDQSAFTAAQFSAFFGANNGVVGTFTNKSGGAVPVHGLICPLGKTCNNEPNNDKHGQVVTASQGIRGDLCQPGAAAAADCSMYPNVAITMNNIINSTISAAGYKMQKPPIGASVKVALNDVADPVACNKNDLPRSRVNGFDFDGINRTIALFGACRPSVATMSAAVSYRYWIDTTLNPNGSPPPCFNDSFYDPLDPDFCKGKLACNLTTNTCECPSNCGGNIPPGKVCNTNKLVCDYVCTSDCGGTCSGYQQCNSSACTCECVQSASCATGYKFQNGGGVCGCVCDTAALNCAADRYTPDPASCACLCKPDCGGCPTGQVCNPSTCACTGGVN